MDNHGGVPTLTSGHQCIHIMGVCLCQTFAKRFKVIESLILAVGKTYMCRVGVNELD